MMRYRNLPLLIVGAAVCFALGRLSVDPSSLSGMREGPKVLRHSTAMSSDALATRQSSRISSKTGEITSADPTISVDAFETYSRKMPFSVMKRIYFERKDEEQRAISERYAAPAEGNPDYKESNEGLFSRFQFSESGEINFSASGDWVLKSGKRVPYRVFVEFYSTDRNTDFGTTLASPAAAKKPDDLCWHSQIYLEIEGANSHFGTSTCLVWTSRREGVPFVVFENHHSKRMLAHFDSIAVPLPGFGTEADVSPEWYDSTKRKWTPISEVRWESISKADSKRIRDDLGKLMADEF